MRKISGLVVYFGVVLWITMVTLTALAVSDWLFNDEFYDRLLDDPALYEDDVAVRLVTFSMADRVANDPAYVENHVESLNAFATALGSVLPEHYVRDELRNLTADLLEYVEGDTDKLNAGIDLVRVKDVLSEGGAETFVSTYAAEMPECKAGAEPFDSGFMLPDCRAGSTEAMQAQILTALPHYLDALPDSLDISVNVAFQDVSVAVRAFTTIGIIIAGLLLLADSRLTGRGMDGWFSWLGLFLLLPGAITFIMGLVIQMGLVDTPVRDGIANMEIDGLTLSAEFLDALASTVIDAGSDIASGFLFVGLAACLVALAVIGIGAVVPGRKMAQGF